MPHSQINPFHQPIGHKIQHIEHWTTEGTQVQYHVQNKEARTKSKCSKCNVGTFWSLLHTLSYQTAFMRLTLHWEKQITSL